MDHIWNTDQAGKYLGKSAQWLRVNREKLGIPYYQLGRQIRFKKEDLDAWLNHNSVNKGGTLND